MKEFERIEFLQLLSDSMTPFSLESEEMNIPIEENALKLCIVKMLEVKKTNLEICYSNPENNYAFYFLTYGEEKKYLALVSSDELNKWVGYYFLDLNTEFGIKLDKLNYN